MKYIKTLLLASLAIFALACSEDPTSEDPTTGDSGTEQNDDYAGATFAESFPDENDIIKYVPDMSLYPRSIYVDGDNGSDANNGLSEATPIKTFAKLATMSVCGGDQVLLKGGCIFKGMITLDELNSDPRSIHIGSYGDSKARIDAYGYPAAIYISNSSNITISDLKISADGGPQGTYMYDTDDRSIVARWGIYIQSNKQLVENIHIYNVDIRDIYYYPEGDPNIPTGRPCREWSTDGEDNYGWGIRFYAVSSKGIDGLKIEECNINDVSHTGIKMNGRSTATIANVDISKCNLYNCGGPGTQFSYAVNGKMTKSRTVCSGSRSDSRKWGRGSGVWMVYSDGFLFDYNYYERAEGIADCCGAHIDIGNTNIVIQRCVSKDNCGGFVEVLGKNSNCCYRYNVSINDGWRNFNKDSDSNYIDQLQAAYWGSTVGGDGSIVTINGHTTTDFEGPDNIYVYNNTIIVHESRTDGYQNPFSFEFATSSTGIVMQNNIFWLGKEKLETSTWSEHSYDPDTATYTNNAVDFRTDMGLFNNVYARVRDMTQSEIDALHIVMKNNLYKYYNSAYPLAENILPDNASQGLYNYNVETGKSDILSEARYWDESPLGGDPGFVNAAGLTAEDFIPTNSSITTLGTTVEKLPCDNTSYGICSAQSSLATYEGFVLDVDLFGNPISSNLMGAVSPL
ncbi:MAG: right-handed parallel beta-helix repeat-containing protein [Rikenellaceae bacterium]